MMMTTPCDFKKQLVKNTNACLVKNLQETNNKILRKLVITGYVLQHPQFYYYYYYYYYYYKVIKSSRPPGPLENWSYLQR